MNKILAIVLALLLGLALLPAAALAADLPLLTRDGDLVADANTRFITAVKQDPASKLITATVQVRHASSGGAPLVIQALGIEISFNNQVAPYNKTGNTLFSGRLLPVNDDGNAEFARYCDPLVPNFNNLGSLLMQRNAAGNMIGAKLSSGNVITLPALIIPAGQTWDVIEFYFMPVNGTANLDLDMFSFKYIYDSASFIRLTNWLMNGTYSLQATNADMTGVSTTTVAPSAFKLHVQRPQPAVSADNTARAVTGYNSATMEWSASQGGAYTSSAPSAGDIGSAEKTIYVRGKGDATYSGNDALYGNYKMYTPSEPVEVKFSAATSGDIGGGGGTPTTNTYTVTFHSNYDNDTVITTVKVESGKTIGANNMPSDPRRDGYTFKEWNTQANGGGDKFSGSTVVTNNTHVYAQWLDNGEVPPTGGGGEGDGSQTTITPELPPLAGFLAEHIPYLNGYPDNTVRPDNPITRAEVAAIFFRLLSSAEKNQPRPTIFTDVVGDSWYVQAVNYLASIEILTGYPEGDFKPNAPITRAEFAAVASRFDKLAETSVNAFPDVTTHWAKDYINSAYAKGWVSGYPDGTFKPQQNITRAEVVKVVNTMLNRKIHAEDIPAGVKQFSDFAGHWAYAEIVEASNAHDYSRKYDGYEIWTLK